MGHLGRSVQQILKFQTGFLSISQKLKIEHRSLLCHVRGPGANIIRQREVFLAQALSEKMPKVEKNLENFGSNSPFPREIDIGSGKSEETIDSPNFLNQRITLISDFINDDHYEVPN